MVRTQIQLTEEQARKLRSQARREGVSLAEAIRRLVDRGLAEERADRRRLYERAAVVVGRFRDRRGAKDVATEHDAYLDEAYPSSP
ncbi:MAG TPA: ribbon-helix-helix protein, CopG family [Anaeromyxobacteraceae bacterium]|nr:ribbon-helix-helix protein, CopG family [Anaeromyxobacteraceae bacterium]